MLERLGIVKRSKRKVCKPNSEHVRKVIALRASDDERARWAVAAASQGMTLSKWMRCSLDAQCFLQNIPLRPQKD